MATPNRAVILRRVAAETKSFLSEILSKAPDINLSSSSIHNLKDTPLPNPIHCPGFTLPEDDPDAERKGTRIRVYDQDTFDAALQLQPDATLRTTTLPIPDNDAPPAAQKKPVAVLNLASERHPGGGWQNGALAQEEALCFRSSLYLSLHKGYYPLPPLSAIYSPSVLLVRSSMAEGHELYPQDTPVEDLPITSVISVAGLRHPKITTGAKYADPQDREVTKSKIRIMLRVAMTQGHRKLVLGALGCGVFGNPPAEVAKCFLEVFREEEFQGGWWEDVVFAVLDNARGKDRGKDGSGNFGLFYRALEGKIV